MSAETPATPTPFADEDSAEWWAALGRHELLLQHCERCGRLRWPARVLCNRCGSFAWEWVSESGDATLASWTVTWHPFVPHLPLPYVSLAARLRAQDDIVMLGWYDGPSDASDLAIGQLLQLGFRDVDQPDGPALTLLSWRRSGG